MRSDVPLLIPEVDHLALLRPAGVGGGGGRHRHEPQLRRRRPRDGARAAPPRLRGRGGLRDDAPGALRRGLSGRPSLDALGNVIPFIDGEEEKIETEPGKILGTLGAAGVVADRLQSRLVRPRRRRRRARRVGLREALAEGFARGIREALEHGRAAEARPSVGPAAAVVVRDERDRPQPIRDVEAGNGMVVTVGRLRPIRSTTSASASSSTTRSRRGGGGAPQRRAPRGNGYLRTISCS